MATTTQTLNWTEIDPTSLSPELQKAYQEYKDAYRMATQFRDKFEEAMNVAAELPKGKELKFGYRFGKLSIAIGDAVVKAVKATGKQSLGDYLKAMQGAGQRT